MNHPPSRRKRHERGNAVIQGLFVSVQYRSFRGGTLYCVWIGTHEWLTTGVMRFNESPFFPLVRSVRQHEWPLA